MRFLVCGVRFELKSWSASCTFDAAEGFAVVVQGENLQQDVRVCVCCEALGCVRCKASVCVSCNASGCVLLEKH